MRIKDLLYNKYYPPTVLNRITSQRRNKNKNFTLLCGNCMGGYIYHQLGLEFKSPTINLMILQPDLLKLVHNFEEYRSCEFSPVNEKKRGIAKGKLKDIIVSFTHYDSYEEGVKKWQERIKRVNKDNLFIIMTDRDGISSMQIESLGTIKCKKIVIFTAKKYEFPWCFQMKGFEQDACVGNIMKKSLSGKWSFEKQFDYVGWLNSEDVVAEHFRVK